MYHQDLSLHRLLILDPEDLMGNARHKLNIAYVNGCLFVSALFGLTAQSWLVFWITLLFMVACGIYGGEIRPTATRR